MEYRPFEHVSLEPYTKKEYVRVFDLSASGAFLIRPPGGQIGVAVHNTDSLMYVGNRNPMELCEVINDEYKMMRPDEIYQQVVLFRKKQYLGMDTQNRIVAKGTPGASRITIPFVGKLETFLMEALEKKFTVDEVQNRLELELDEFYSGQLHMEEYSISKASHWPSTESKAIQEYVTKQGLNSDTFKTRIPRQIFLNLEQRSMDMIYKFVLKKQNGKESNLFQLSLKDQKQEEIQRLFDKQWKQTQAKFVKQDSLVVFAQVDTSNKNKNQKRPTPDDVLPAHSIAMDCQRIEGCEILSKYPRIRVVPIANRRIFMEQHYPDVNTDPDHPNKNYIPLKLAKDKNISLDYKFLYQEFVLPCLLDFVLPVLGYEEELTSFVKNYTGGRNITSR